MAEPMAGRSTPMTQVAARIKQAREAAALSQHELADRAGVSRPTVARLESGGDVNTATLRKIAEVLGLSLQVSERSS